MQLTDYKCSMVRYAQLTIIKVCTQSNDTPFRKVASGIFCLPANLSVKLLNVHCKESATADLQLVMQNRRCDMQAHTVQQMSAKLLATISYTAERYVSENHDAQCLQHVGPIL